jgi:hypothetical protein
LSSSAIDILLRKLEKVRHAGPGQWSALCPAHDDTNASLSITLKNAHKLLLHCHAGCSPESVLAAVGLVWKDILPPREQNPERVIVETYPYRNETGELLFEVVRFAPKDFRQRRPDGSSGWLWNLNGARRVLYRLPELCDADPEASVLVVEGEKDVDRLRSLGYVATCNPGGAGKWQDGYSEALRGHSVIVIPDADNPGRAHAQGVAKALVGVAASVAVLELPDAKDVSAFFDRGGSSEQLDRLLADAKEWKPTQSESDSTPPLAMSFAEFMAEQDAHAQESLLGDALLVPGGGYLVLSGDTGVGKTIVLANLAFALAAKWTNFLGFKLPGRPVRVLFLQAEGSRAAWRKRLRGIAEKLGVPLEDLPIFIPRRDAQLSIKTFPKMIEQIQPELVIPDPITRFFEGDDNKSDVWKEQVTKPLGTFGRQYGTAFAFTDHYGKPNEQRTGQFKLRGSSAKLQDCGAGLRLEMGQGGSGRRLLIFDRVRDGALPFSDEPTFDGSSRLGLKLDVAAGVVELDPEGAPTPAPESPRDRAKAKRREADSAAVQAELERIIREKQPRDGYPGLTTNELAAYAKMGKGERPFRDALTALEAQKVIESKSGPKGSVCWRLKVQG